MAGGGGGGGVTEVVKHTARLMGGCRLLSWVDSSWSHHQVGFVVRYLFTEGVKRTARLVAEWQGVGWCHG